MEEIDKLHGLHNTGMTMHERFTLLAKQTGRRKGNPRPARGRGRARTNAAVLRDVIQQLNQAQTPIGMFGGRGRGRRGLWRAGSEGSLRNMPGLRRGRSNSFGYDDGLINNNNNNQKWRQSNGNLSKYAGSVNGSVHSGRSLRPRSLNGYWLRDTSVRRGQQGARGRGRPRGRGARVGRGRVVRVNSGPPSRPARGTGRRGMRRDAGHAARGRSRGRGRGWGTARGRPQGRGGVSQGSGKPVPTKEELDQQLEEYMSSTKAALDRQLDEYMRNAMDFE